MFLEDYIDSAIRVYTEKLNAKPPEDKSKDPLLDFYNENSKLTDGDRKMGKEKIVEQLRKEQRELTIESYTKTAIDEDHVIVTGDCVYGNNKTAFTIAFECTSSGFGENTVFISNQIMNI